MFEPDRFYKNILITIARYRKFFGINLPQEDRYISCNETILLELSDLKHTKKLKGKGYQSNMEF